ncbi:MAG: hypothetical protein ACYC9M_12770 [Desulfobulbaceae bacterium]
MASRTCPKCSTKNEDAATCGKCGLNFAEYDRTKLERLGEVHKLLSEGRFREAKLVAEKLPAQFPDKKTDFVLLLSNINRDISIVEKYELAQKAYDGGDYGQACLLLRNIKAFDSTLNERVVSLRRKAERPLHDSEQFNRAVEAFHQGNYPAAKALFKQVSTSGRQEEIGVYLRQIAARTKEVLGAAIDCINTRQFALAETRFAELEKTYPDLHDEIAGYISLLARRSEIREQIMGAANRARTEQRLVEAKILYSYLGREFPESLPEIMPRLQEIGARTVVSLADLQELGTVDLAALGVDIGAGRAQTAAADPDADVPRDRPAADIPAAAAVPGNSPASADEFTPPLEIDVEEIPDFIF